MYFIKISIREEDEGGSNDKGWSKHEEVSVLLFNQTTLELDGRIV
jgi:hypothetical protein